MTRGDLGLCHAVSLWMPGAKGVVAPLGQNRFLAPHEGMPRFGSCRLVSVCVCVCVCVLFFNLFACTTSSLWQVGSSSLTKDRTQAPCIGRLRQETLGSLDLCR